MPSSAKTTRIPAGKRAKITVPKNFCFLVLLLIPLSGCGWNPLGPKEEYVRRGRDFAAQGKLDDAAFQFRKAIQMDPEYGEAYLRFGEVLTKQNQPADAFHAFFRAVELIPASQPDQVKEAKTGLGRMAISALLVDPRRPQMAYDAANKMAAEFLAADPKSFEGLRLRGYLAIADSKPKDAIDYFRQILADNPNVPEIVTVLTQTLMADHQDQEAETLARNGLSTFKTYGPLYDTLYGYYMSHNRPAEAEELLRSKIANNPKETLFVIQLAEHLWRQKKPQQVDDLLRNFVANSADYPTAPLEAGDFYRRTGNPEEAVRAYQNGLETSGHRKPDQTKEYLKRIVAVRLSEGHAEEASDAIEAVLRQFPDDVDTLVSRADLRMGSGKPDEIQKAVSELAELARKEPARIDVHYSLARAYRQLGRDQDAETSFLEILQRDPKNPDALRALADMSIRAQKPDDAISYAERLLDIDPNNTGARLVRTAAWALQGRFTELRGELRHLTTDNPNLTEAWLQTATLDVATKNYSEAEDIFRRLDVPGKGDFRATKGLVLVYMTQGQPQKALAVIRQDAARSANPQVRVLLASTAAQAGDLDLALDTSQKLASDFPNDPDDLILLGEICQRKGQLDQAIAAFRLAQTKAPGDTRPGSFLADALSQAGRLEESVEVSRKNLRIRPDDPSLMNALAWQLALAGKNLNEAATLAQRALQKEPANDAFMDTAGMISLQSGKLDDAFRTFQGLVLRRGSIPAYRTHLAATLIRRGDRDKARVELETALRNHPSPTEEEEIRRLLKSGS